ncbi:hypothetical protein [Paraliobacillus ryukyuensis]|uniref:hypothetical protein n=1 Tax=Paraliobacillus ryukyuensis TaxID=200904 RepID=UPI0009A5A2E9|nr:hypothetical protein [Paraliobacillus ryukyuensis]
MKKIFYGIGILVAVFSFFFFLLVADKMVYHNDDTIYEFELSQSISGKELKEIAEDTNLMIRLANFENSSFGRNVLEVTFINPDSTINLGKQPSVFPKNKITYNVFDGEISKKIKFFTIQSNDSKKIENIKSVLKKRGYSVSVLKNEAINFSLGMLFSALNMKFFSLLTLLIILSIATYYVYRLKEIGILKLHGWNNRRISFRLLSKLLLHSYLSSLFLVIPFSIYIFISDVSKLILYAQIYILLCFFLAIVFLLSAVVGTLYIYKVNQVGAIKNKRNNKLLFYTLIIFKFIIVALLSFSLNTSIKDSYQLNANIQSISKLQNYDLYKIQTSVIPDEKIHKKLDRLINTLDPEHVYNYSPTDHRLDITKLKLYQSSGKLRARDEYAYTSISPNTLTFLDIVDESGHKIDASQVKANTLLIPIHIKNDVEIVRDYYQLEKNTKIIYIKNGQVQDNILLPGYYIYDSIYYIHELKRKLYLNSGEVLLDKKGADFINQELDHLGIDTNSIRIDSLNNDYNILKGNFELDLFESLFHVIINLLSFFLCVLSIMTIFLELRKKELAVYRLVGIYPINSIGKFTILNGIITIGITLIVNPSFLILFFIEGIIYGVLLHQYMKRKAVLVLKGE